MMVVVLYDVFLTTIVVRCLQPWNQYFFSLLLYRVFLDCATQPQWESNAVLVRLVSSAVYLYFTSGDVLCHKNYRTGTNETWTADDRVFLMYLWFRGWFAVAGPVAPKYSRNPRKDT